MVRRGLFHSITNFLECHKRHLFSLMVRSGVLKKKKRFNRSVFSHDVTAAILVFQNNETAAMLVFQTNPVGVELFSYVNNFFYSHTFA